MQQVSSPQCQSQDHDQQTDYSVGFTSNYAEFIPKPWDPESDGINAKDRSRVICEYWQRLWWLAFMTCRFIPQARILKPF
jgi:hypothetical protein